MAGYLPGDWSGKHVGVRFNHAGHLEARLVDTNDGGMTVEVTQSAGGEEGQGPTRSVFIPWSAVQYVELLEESQRLDDDLTEGPIG